MEAIHNPAVRKRVLAISLTVSLWLVFLFGAIRVFGPDSSYVFFDSDTAIPVLMANEKRAVAVFDLYYYGQDRWGAWPMLSARLIRYATNYQWTDQSFHVMSTIWLFVGILAMAGLSRRDHLPVTLVFLITLCLHSVIRLRLFHIAQPYPWQITALLLGWYSLRQLLGMRAADSPQGSSMVRCSAWLFLTFWFSFLAIWCSFASAPFLLFLTALETWRAHFQNTRKLSVNWVARRYARGVIPVLAAIAAEMLIRINYQRHALKHYGNAFKTEIAFDYGYLSQDLYRQLVNLGITSWWPLVLLPAIAVIAFGGISIYFCWKKQNESLAKLKDLIVDDCFFLILGSFGIALINFAIIATLSHVRMNLYDNRYTSLTYLFGFISGILTLFSAFRTIAGTTRIRYAVAAILIGGVAILALKFPPKRYSPDYVIFKETAATLAQKCPQCVLMGGYWETYVFSGLQPIDTMIPLPFEGQYLRMPWNREKLREASRVIVEYRHSKLASAESPPQSLVQYGNSLRLVDPKWYENEKYSFALYARETK